MKYFKFYSWAILLALCAGLFSSCSKDDDKVDEDSIVGIWYLFNLTADIQNPTNPELEEEEKAMTLLTAAFLHGSVLEIKPDKTFVWTVAGMGNMLSGSYKSNGDHFSITEAIDSESYDFLAAGALISLSLKDGVLTMTENDIDAEYGDDGNGNKITTTLREMGFTKYEFKYLFKK
ncbi:MAG: hypothetical protein LBS43_03160 [Prevotellaceae bacterium]|jgi:hypothetical protein|nr:hypothetical protein [Prevotellaceae bacterium]